ncbi:MAG: DMT family transporter [Caulobacteraceae bacterium]
MAASSESKLEPLEWAAIAVIVVTWGVNNAAAKFATAALPPLFVGGMRFAFALVMLASFIRPPFPNWRTLLPIMVLAGPLHFGLIYIAFDRVQNLSLMGVTLQLWVPLTALFAWLVLGERLSKSAMAGVALAFAGSAWMTLEPHNLGNLWPVAIGLGASVCWAMATVLVRRAPAVPALKLQGIISLATAPVLLGAAVMTEPNLPQQAASASIWVWLSVVFAGLVSTVGASALLFWLVQRRETGRVTPYLLATPLVTTALGVSFFGDVMTPQLVIGGLAAMAGVGLVAISERRRARLALSANQA